MRKILAALSLLLFSTALFAQANYRPPTVYAGSLLVVKWTAGTVNNGGHAVAVTANSGTGTSATSGKNDCSAPSYTSCNIVYTNSSGTVAVTTSIATASASGNVILAFIETNELQITRVSYGWQNGAAFSGAASTGGASTASVVTCGTTSTCAVTPVSGAKFAYGTVALSSASPSAVTITALPFTTSSSYVCTATPTGNTAAIAAAGVAITYVSASSITLTGPNTVTTVINYSCIGT